MLESIISGILLAFLSGITFLAYKHPPGYRALVVRLVIPVVVGLGLSGATTALFDIYTNAQTGLMLVEKFPDHALASFSSELAEVRDIARRLLWGLGIFLASVAYLAFLWFLPALTHGKDANAA